MASFSPNPPSARAYGIKTGEALMMARKKCPHLQIFPPHYELYTRRSAEFMELLRRYAPEVEAYSIDEAFCDMTGTRSLYGDPVTFAHTLKDTIHKELGFTVNVGISNNRLLAKMASDFENPDRVHTLGFPTSLPPNSGRFPSRICFSSGNPLPKSFVPSASRPSVISPMPITA